MKPLIALVGRPNVGKSTLFNRILRQKSAIIDSTPGVTRDRHMMPGEWTGKQFLLMDTGGYSLQGDVISMAMLEQTMMAIRDADCVVFLTDVRSGLTYEDLEISRMLQRNFQEKQIFFAVNKVESPQLAIDAESFVSTGFTHPYFISARDGSGVADMLDDILEILPAQEGEGDDDDPAIKLAIVGRPNVGKSSVVNALLGTNRQIVSDIPGTTRDAIDSKFTRKQQEFVLIDTAGLRKRTKIDAGIEFYSSLRTERAIERCQVAMVLLDARQGIEKQDLRIINMAAERKKGVLLLVNKWDLIEKDSKTSKIYEDTLRSHMGNLSWIPVLFVSALTKKNLYRAIDTAEAVSRNRSRKISTSALNRFLEEALAAQLPSTKSGKELKIKYMTQIESHWPIFAFFCNNPELVQTNFRKFLENRLREQFSLEGVPISLRFMQK
ncbi:MAG: ribosome biogenesis GTPase Der [Chlorobium sp.]|jgi:GTP-binding protein|uniref:ribosome biogenesis GTPase Der n=1 Tax=Chlorobium sp. TaxID=1095 RepID=UPI001DB6DF75|nr:ribosome biogenesis GTPase Der [Chlorobium sp.]MBN1278596.1 ribosome biogenesis GTPase Der [Chlorobiaceae bacterium]MCF8215484.1 ribosome biogenesis GTPase Der [Chlorobium sp.]MCF8270291.1 ribosome biogenesis GTPase Der [Chlorobium sp.]MCF8286691.1 ribosome biogenesis GTPase Der [Chlorobium sp.]MCF8290384.1 ribosome biogenesis GTPase Der [Chlorobium sp.]